MYYNRCGYRGFSHIRRYLTHEYTLRSKYPKWKENTRDKEYIFARNRNAIENKSWNSYEIPNPIYRSIYLYITSNAQNVFSRHFTYLSVRVKSQNHTFRRIRRTRDNDFCTRFEMSVLLLLLEHDVVIFDAIAVCRHKPKNNKRQ